jgi:hypothetical protein
MAAPGEFALAVQPEAQLGCFWASHATRAQAGDAEAHQHARPSYSDGRPASAGVELSLAQLLPGNRWGQATHGGWAGAAIAAATS